MFLPDRYKNFAIYDIVSLIAPKSKIEERIFLEAVRRIPLAFQVGDPWGEEIKQGSLWIDEYVFESYEQKIRLLLRSDPDYLESLSVSIKKDIETFSAEVNKNLGVPENHIGNLLNSCATSVSWLATNWLNPFFYIRMSLARLMGSEELEKNFDLLIRFKDIPFFIQAYLALKDMKEGGISDEEYRTYWGAAFNAGDITGRLSVAGSAQHLAEDIAPSNDDVEKIVSAFQEKTRSRKLLVAKLLDRSMQKDGADATALLSAQIKFSSLIVWQEETRHHLQQQTYIIFRKFMKNLAANETEDLAKIAPWMTPALSIIK